jgi:hypothetical protein
LEFQTLVNELMQLGTKLAICAQKTSKLASHDIIWVSN